MPAKLSNVQRVNSNNIALHENIVQMTTVKKSKVFEHEITNIVLTHQLKYMFLSRTKKMIHNYL